MAKLNKTKLKALVDKYLPMLSETSIEALTDIISNDPDAEGNTEQVIEAIKAENTPDSNDPDAEGNKSKGKQGTYIVVTPFRDKDNFNKEWDAGNDVSHFDAERLKMLVDKKLVDKK